MVDYNKFAKEFSKSRKDMKWEEIQYFLSTLTYEKKENILDVWCWSARLLWELKSSKVLINSYLWVDLSSWLLEGAKESYPNDNFLELDMLNLDKIDNKFTSIFFIASFHHLKTIEDRLVALDKVYNLLEEWWKIYMTNWALDSVVNNEKYINRKIIWSENKYWWSDYNIKFWDFNRFYHCFSLEELNYLFTKAWFKVIKNYLFENNKNYVSIISR